MNLSEQEVRPMSLIQHEVSGRRFASNQANAQKVYWPEDPGEEGAGHLELHPT
jgi:hypothetical protein